MTKVDAAAKALFESKVGVPFPADLEGHYAGIHKAAIAYWREVAEIAIKAADTHL